MLILNVLAPVFLIIVLGAWMQRAQFVSPGFLREANRVTYWLGLPALLFSQLVSSLHAASGAEPLLGAMLLTTLLVTAAGYAVAVLLRVPSAAQGTFVQGAFRGNLAFVGLPIVFSLPDVPVAGGLGLHAAAIIVVAPVMVLYNVAGIVVLVMSRHAFGWKMLGPVVKQLAVTPPLLATLAGVGFAAAGWKLPHAVDQTFTALGEMALPLGLLGVGGSLVAGGLGESWRWPLASALVKTAGGAVIGGLTARWCGLAPAAVQLVMILAATPTAIVSYTLAIELDGDERLASANIAYSVPCSLVTLAAILALG